MGSCALLRCGLAEEREALRLVASRGYTNPKAVERSVFGRHRMGCQDSDDIGFVIEAGMEGGGRIRLHVCCGSSFRGCRFVLAPYEMSDR